MAISSTSFKKGISGNPSGRKRKQLPTDGHALITVLAAKGNRERDIAAHCGMSHVTWTRRKAEDPSIEEALEAGRAIWHNQLVGKLHSKAMKGDTVALLFLLKTRFGYREGDSPQESRPTITINLPGSLDAAQYAKAITINAESTDE